MKILRFLSLALLSGACLLTGCTTLPKAADMTPATVELKNRASHPVKLVVEGEPKREKTVQVGNAELAQAIRMTIEKSQIFSKVVESVSEGYLLEVTVVGYNPPRPGFNMSATMTTRWRLTRLSNREVIFDDFFKKTHTAKVGDAFVGATRWRKANEGMVRDTIADGLQRISQLNL